MLSKTLVAASTKPLILAILRNGENYGYQIIQSVRRISGNKRLRRYYRLTEKGIKVQEQERAQWSMINDIFGQVLSSAPTLEG